MKPMNLAAEKSANNVWDQLSWGIYTQETADG